MKLADKVKLEQLSMPNWMQLKVDNIVMTAFENHLDSCIVYEHDLPVFYGEDLEQVIKYLVINGFNVRKHDYHLELEIK